MAAESRRRKGRRPVPIGQGSSPVAGPGLAGGPPLAKQDEVRCEVSIPDSEARFHQTFEHAAAGIAHVGPDGRWLWVNQRLCDIVGYSRDELLRLAFQDITHPSDLEADLANARRLLAGQIDRYAIEKRYIHKDGSVVWINLTVSLVRTELNRPDHFISIIEDITRRKLAEQALRESEARMRSIVDTIVDGVITIDESGTIQTVNAAVERIFGYSESELVGRNIADLMPEPYRSRHDAYLANYQRTGVARVIGIGRAVEGLRRDGSTFPLDLSVGEFGIDGRQYYTGVVRDITDRTRAERALRASEQVYRAIGESIPFGVWICDPEGRNTYTSESFLQLVGLTQEQCSQFGWGDVLHPDDAGRTIAAWKECVRVEGTWDIEHRFRGADGRWHPILARGVPVRDDHGRVVCWAGINLDIGRLKEAEEALRESEERFRQLADNLHKGAIYQLIQGRDGTASFRYVSAGVERLFGVTTAMVTADPMTMYGSVLEEDRPRMMAEEAAAFRHRTPFDCQFRQQARDGQVKWVHCRSAPRVSGAEVIWDGFVLDITEQKLAEQALRESEERQHRALSAARIGHWEWDLETDRVTYHGGLEALYGRTDGASWSTYEEFLGLIHPDDRAGLVAAIGRCLAEGTPLEAELRVVRPDGSIHWLASKGGVFRDRSGKPIRMAGVNIDITERKVLQAELLSIAEQEQRRIGQDLHDDVGQELTGVSLMAEALVEALEEGGVPEAGLAARIRSRLGHIQERIQVLARGLIPVEVDARGLMDALEELSVSVGMLHGIESTFECETPVQIQDNRVATQLYRITQEAIANAIKHGQARGIRVELRERAGVIMLEIRDDGIGIPDESRRGSGMGLKIMQYRAGLFGGTLDVGPAEGRGTRVVCSISGGRDDVRSRGRDGR